MMHYAPLKRKCLLHHVDSYSRSMETANERLIAVRSKKYRTAVEAADAMGLKRATYIQHENGTRGSGSIPRGPAQRYAQFFRVSLDWLLTGKGEGLADDPDPTEAELVEMLRDAIDGVVTMDTRLSDLPRIVAPALREQLARYRAGTVSQRSEDGENDRGTSVQSPLATKPSARAG
jgi:transcriptional regulator with XRE-family HTH domain